MIDLTKEQEEHLIESAKASESGFAELYERYFDMVFNYILKRTGDMELSQDLTSGKSPPAGTVGAPASSLVPIAYQ